MIDFDPILPNLLVGSFPSSRVDARRLAVAGVNAVVNLQSDTDFARLGVDWSTLEFHYHDLGLTAHRVPMVDFDEADIALHLPRAAECLNRAMAPDNRVYLHCTAGRERSPTTAVAWLAWYGGHALDDALLQVRSARRLANPYEAILRRLSLSRQAENQGPE